MVWLTCRGSTVLVDMSCVTCPWATCVGLPVIWITCPPGDLSPGSPVLWVTCPLGHLSLDPLSLVICHLAQLSFGSPVLWVTCPLGHLSFGVTRFGSPVLWVICPLGDLASGSPVPWVTCRLGHLSFGSPDLATAFFHGLCWEAKLGIKSSGTQDPSLATALLLGHSDFVARDYTVH